jgi:hypothetical protein
MGRDDEAADADAEVEGCSGGRVRLGGRGGSSACLGSLGIRDDWPLAEEPVERCTDYDRRIGMTFNSRW